MTDLTSALECAARAYYETTRPRLDEIEKRANEATAGNWSTRDGLDEFGDDGLPDIVVNSEWLVDAPIPHSDADAEFIAAARTDVPALTAALRAVLAVHERVYRVFSWAHGGATDYPPCSTCDGAPGVHECGCWADEQIEYVCAACDAPKRRTTWPCDTVRAITAHIDVTSPTLHDLTDTRGPRA